MTTLVGRDLELSQIQALIDAAETRLVTLTGPGGIGKTRLAIAVAAAMEPDFAHGACFVGLASVRDPALIPVAVARALGLQESGDRSAVELVMSAMRDRHLLLVLDNLEHVVEAAAIWTSELLGHCPRLTVLATSRIVLQIGGEQRYPVPPLGLPEAATNDPVASSAAVDLFVQRARAVRPDFALTAHTAKTVRRICLALDGMPLAIELAAARLQVLSPDALLARLTDRLAILQGNVRDAQPRHRAMRDTIAWSYDLLSPDQQALFQRLAVFTGGFSLDAAEAVGGDRALDLLTDLLDHSLVRQEVLETGESRYRMLEVVREYAQEQLDVSGESAAARDAMSAWCQEFAAFAAEGIQGAEQIAWLGRLDAELDNIRGALAWLQERERIPEAQELAGAVSIFLLIRAYYTEARALYEPLVAHPLGADPAVGRAWCLIGLGVAAFNQGGDAPRSMAAFDESVAICRHIGARRTLVWALTCRALPLMRTGRGDQAHTDCTEAVALARDAGYRWGEASARSILGMALTQRGDLAGAQTEMQASIDLCMTLGESWVRAISTGNLAVAVLMPRGELELAETYLQEGDRLMRLVGDNLNYAASLEMRAEIARVRGDAATAEELLWEALAVGRKMGDAYAVGHALRLLGLLAAEAGDVGRAADLLRESMARMSKLGAADDMVACFDAYADVAIAAGAPATAARMIGATDAALVAHGSARWESVPGEHEARVAAIVGALGDDGYRAAWQAGNALSLEQAISETVTWAPGAAVTSGRKAPSRLPEAASHLTPRELEVLQLMAEGLTNQQIADRLYLSRRTATSHASNILAKLDLPSRTAAVAWALRNGLA